MILRRICMSVVFMAVTLCVGLKAEATNKIGQENTYMIQEDFKYPITPEDPEWAELGSVQARVEACRIPRDILENMTEGQLIQAVLDFPFLCDVFFYSDYKDGVKKLEEKSDAYAELLHRGNAKAELLKVVEERNMERAIGITVEEEIENDALAILILFQDKFDGKLTLEEAQKVDFVSPMINLCGIEEVSFPELYSSVKITTPKGTEVQYILRSCSHINDSTYHARKDQYAVDTYVVTLVSGGSCKYNCHSYAWYDHSTSNLYWINDPSAYMTDGSYSNILSGSSSSSVNVVEGDIVFYGTTSNPIHSAVMDSSLSGAPLASRTVISKWGDAGIFRHTLAACPYDTSNVSVWR